MKTDFRRPATENEREWRECLGLAVELLSQARSFHLLTVNDEGRVVCMFPVRKGTTDADAIRETMLGVVNLRDEGDPPAEAAPFDMSLNGIAYCSQCGRDLHGYRGPLCRYCDGTAE